ncbi:MULTISPECIES: glucose-6-phosphate dehydrogenase [Photobacterium]|uniref:Glucose-6-phosphate 1-dehydrogenase n=1 Tax=Photobacterium ganghwense TaxID=320778 RepID=A0A0J1HJA2_9GAMM|nr:MULTISPECIES: glucose-6-phosphate dehydrogenase [Photobacterium]KLV11678.1 glucose-6-phosphate dehydrogenase [Photobacterium ganghwense]MBV1840981.1 glucose-6-phosphate dehydrogenase [Photobacterium ganghwense]PSU08685.1 glucose-6-phosphate dehydrogenase [Photobacterium ganghwense]QSV15281.1 glucose-6-phosphate dehydrogenase [Photobacterium ganghwense]
MIKPENNCIVIFGASGDLTQRKLIPAFYHLYANGLLSEEFAILGVSRTHYSDEEFQQKLKASLTANEKVDPETLDAFCQRLHYQAIDTSDVEDYANLKNRLEDIEQAYQTGGNTTFYLATPPSLYSVIPQCLAHYGLNTEDHGWKRLIVEKPFGYDLATAKQLDKDLHAHFQEHQIYRIDHYLGKETVQNLLVFRFANGMFEPLWNRNFIDYVEITAAEFLGVEERGGYYDGAGAVRDMFQNHLLQVLAMVGMEPPAAINADSMRDEVMKVFKSLKPLSETDLHNNLVLGQYTASEVRGDHLIGYREEPGVAEDSRTETYVGLKMFIDNWRWNGVPFYVRTGKRLPTRVTEVVIHFKKTPHPVFGANAPENKLIIRIQPDEGILMSFGLKKPGAGFDAKEVSMDFHYESLEETHMLTAYERLLLDSMKGDATLFARSDAVNACWQFVQPILDYKENPEHLYGYAAGTWGPKEADELLARDNREWRFPCKNLTNTDYCEL